MAFTPSNLPPYFAQLEGGGTNKFLTDWRINTIIVNDRRVQTRDSVDLWRGDERHRRHTGRPTRPQGPELADLRLLDTDGLLHMWLMSELSAELRACLTMAE